jgi:hypothetical protein
MAVLAAMLFVALPATEARADWQTERAQAIAAKVWGNPCGGRVTLTFTAPLRPNWRAWAYPHQCEIGMSTGKPWTWEDLCPVLIHEYGHLAGYSNPANAADPAHSQDPTDVMWPYLQYDARCDDHGAALLGPAQPAVAAAGAVGRGMSAKRKPARRAQRKPRRALR